MNTKMIITTILIILLNITNCFSQPRWFQVAPGTYTSAYGPQDALQAIFLATDAATNKKPNEWHTVNLSGSLPIGAKAIALSGIGIITNPSNTAGIYGGTLAVRRKGSNYESAYGIQVLAVNFVAWDSRFGYIAVYPGNGDRKPGYTVVALNENREFEFKYTIQSPSGGAPLTPGVNFQLNFCVPMWYGLPDLFPWL